MREIIINNKKLDEEQLSVVYNEDKYLLVIAGAGSGKTLTIAGKVKYIIEEKNINPSKILCLSFTNEATDNLKDRIGNDKVNIMTFHKLGIELLNRNEKTCELCDSDYLDYIIHEFFFGIIFESNYLMRIVLSYFKCFCLFNIEKKYSSYIYKNYDEVLKLERLISRFIKLFKTNGFKTEMFYFFIKKASSRREKLLLLLILNIYLIYSNELNSSGKMDYDDILIKSKDIVGKNGLNTNYKYIIIDEYQDTSFIRFSLIKSIISKTSASLMAVGDDFQSIYKFSGCDIDMFLNFKYLFNDACVLKLNKTYRNSQELIDIAGSFVMKNRKQIRKELKSDKKIDSPIIIIYSDDLKTLINNISTDILILGRNNKDIDTYIDNDLSFSNNKIVYSKRPDLNIRFLTVHSSKGLEEENVIILNVIDDYLGFPNKIRDDKILRFVSKKDYFYEEERRLFYVALTRTKNRVYIMTKKGKESIFIKELLKKRLISRF